MPWQNEPEENAENAEQTTSAVFLVYFARRIGRNFGWLALVTVITAMIGIATDRLIGGYWAHVGGAIQYIGLVVFFFCGITHVLYVPHSPRLEAAMLDSTLSTIRHIIFGFVALYACHSLLFTAWDLVKLHRGESRGTQTEGQSDANQ